METMWTLDACFKAKDFETLKYVVGLMLDEVKKAKTYRELPLSSGCAGPGDGSNWYTYSVTCSSPTEDRIAMLRQEADKLEASLRPVP